VTGKPWIGVDLDGTLAVYAEWNGPCSIGPIIPLMKDRILEWLSSGQVEVKIMTARVCSSQPEGFAGKARKAIQDWLEENGLPRLDVTAEKDFKMIELWDDRAVQVEHNTGKAVGYA
jgi:hypothetical protein